ncbi:MAG: hypothetical protein H6835_03450 [Planctomycetes bacterium]|nr:hypothetical protein [Planctomycetota bacterium]
MTGTFRTAIEVAPERGAAPELPPHAAMLRRYLWVLGARGDRIEDLVQEAFVVALQKGLADRGQAAASAFLRGVAKNLLLRERRSRAMRREVELADAVWHEQCGGDGDDRVEALRRCVEALPDKSRALLTRCYQGGAGREALGAEFGMVPDGIKTALRRLRAGLRECIERRLRGGA